MKRKSKFQVGDVVRNNHIATVQAINQPYKGLIALDCALNDTRFWHEDNLILVRRAKRKKGKP